MRQHSVWRLSLNCLNQLQMTQQESSLSSIIEGNGMRKNIIVALLTLYDDVCLYHCMSVCNLLKAKPTL